MVCSFSTKHKLQDLVCILYKWVNWSNSNLRRQILVGRQRPPLSRKWERKSDLEKIYQTNAIKIWLSRFWDRAHHSMRTLCCNEDSQTILMPRLLIQYLLHNGDIELRPCQNQSLHWDKVWAVFQFKGPPLYMRATTTVASVSAHWIPFVSKKKMQRGFGCTLATYPS